LTNLKIAAAFSEIADLIELKGENPFKIRAYRRAAQLLENLDTDVASLVDTGELRHLEGIGSALAGKITEYVRTGSIGALDKLRQEIPSSLHALTTVPGVGPKVAARLFRELGIRDLAGLEEALSQQRIRELKGFGPKTEANIAVGLEELARYQGRRPLYVALPLARELVAGLQALPAVNRVAIAGSVRRMREMVGDIDIVVATDDSEVIGHHLTHLTLVERVMARGDTKVSLVLHGGLQVDVRMVASGAFASALHHSTGSQAHNVALRSLALAKGLSISEYGLFDRRTKERHEPANEEELYALLGLPYIPPELRENAGEIEAAMEGALPGLVSRSDITGDLHAHSDWSDGTATLEELARAGAARGLRYVAVCDHSRSLSIAGGLTSEQLDARDLQIIRVNEQNTGAMLLPGVEVDILADGSLDLPDEVLRKRVVVVASLHSGLRQERAQLMRRLKAAMENPYVHIIGHPTGRLLGRRVPSDVDVDELIRIASDTGTALEINASPDRLDLSAEHARQAAAAGVMIAINTDAHDVSEFDFLSYGLSVARRAWLEPSAVLNSQPLEDLRQRLALKSGRRRG
jgi:DNA polymerase (family 10)